MSKLYLLMIIEIFIYKFISYAIFKASCLSLPKLDISEDLKRWKFDYKQILYYAVIVLAVLTPQYLDLEITSKNFLIGLIPIVVSTISIFFCHKNKDSKLALIVDFLFLEGLALQINHWICSLIAILYFVIQLIQYKNNN